MSKTKLASGKFFIKLAALWLAVGWIYWGASMACQAQSAPPPDFTPGLQHVVDLAKSGMSDDFILTYITNSGATYNLSVDDIIYLHKQGVSDGVIKGLMATAAPAKPATTDSSNATPPATASANSNLLNAATTTAPTPTPPPVVAAPESPVAPATSPVPTSPVPAPTAPPTAPALMDNFYTDTTLNSALWTMQSGTLSALGSASGVPVYPVLEFSPLGVRMSGVRHSDHWTGIQSTMSYSAPFTFSTTVSGLAENATPFEIYLVSADLQQWISVAGHLGGRGHPHSSVFLGGMFGHGGGGVAVPVGGGRSPEYGMWLNHTGTGLPISALGYKILENPIAGVAYTVQITVNPDGSASMVLRDAAGSALSAQTVSVGTGPFYVVLAARGGETASEWQTVSLTPAAPPMAVAPAPSAVPEAASAPTDAPVTPTLDYFQAQLAPYGNWVTLPGYGLCWQPSVSLGWRPYFDGGYWTYTDDGWYWQSDYPWGDIAFHYGRWAYTVSGWVWVPGYDYAPAWVVWRHADADGYVGWAPLPPGAVFVNGGWLYHGAHVGVDFDFGLGAGYFTFVGYDHFWGRDFRTFVVPHDRLDIVFRHSVFENHYRFDHGHFVNVGMDRAHMEAFTHREIHPVAAMEIRHAEERRNFEVRHDDIHDYHPGQSHPNGMKTVPPQNSGHSENNKDWGR